MKYALVVVLVVGMAVCGCRQEPIAKDSPVTDVNAPQPTNIVKDPTTNATNRVVP